VLKAFAVTVHYLTRVCQVDLCLEEHRKIGKPRRSSPHTRCETGQKAPTTGTNFSLQPRWKSVCQVTSKGVPQNNWTKLCKLRSPSQFKRHCWKLRDEPFALWHANDLVLLASLNWVFNIHLIDFLLCGTKHGYN